MTLFLVPLDNVTGRPPFGALRLAKRIRNIHHIVNAILTSSGEDWSRIDCGLSHAVELTAAVPLEYVLELIPPFLPCFGADFAASMLFQN